jgi:CO/xanthine dehydrogenase FAD-binding subunit
MNAESPVGSDPSLEAALASLAAGPATLLAGGTDLYPATTARALRGAVLDVAGLTALRGVTRDGSGWRIGAATTWAEIARADLPPAFDALRQAARLVGGVQIQNAGTIGGNLCTASPAADGVPPLLTLDATVALRSAAGARRLALGDFLTGPRRTARRPDEVLVAIHAPPVEGRSAFVKLGARAHLVISIAMVAARLTLREGRVAEAALAVGACSPTARRLPAVEAALIGATPAEAPGRIADAAVAAALAPIDDVRASAAYRAHAAAELCRRAVREALA